MTTGIVGTRPGIVFIPPDRIFFARAKESWESDQGKQISQLREGGIPYTPKQVARQMAAAAEGAKVAPGFVFLGKIDQTTEGAVFLFERQSQFKRIGDQLHRGEHVELYGVSTTMIGGREIAVMKDLGSSTWHGLPPGALG